TYTSAWAGLSLHTPGFTTAPYTWLEFAIRTSQSSLPDIRVALYDSGGRLIKQVDPRPYANEVGGGWHKVSIPLSVLGAANTTVTRVQLQEDSGRAQKTFYLDNIRFAP